MVQADPSAPKDYVSGLYGESEDLGYAYWVLYSACVNKAKISFAADSSFTPFFARYEELSKEAKKFKLSKKAKIIIAIVVVYILLFLFMPLFWDKIM